MSSVGARGPFLPFLDHGEIVNIDGTRHLVVDFDPKFKTVKTRVFGGDKNKLTETMMSKLTVINPTTLKLITGTSGRQYCVRSYFFSAQDRIVTCSCPGYRYAGACKHTKA